MSNELATMTSRAIEVLATGNLSNLSPAEKTQHYTAVCSSLGLNPLTRPFEYITLNGKLALYARKDATDQLRKVHGISIEEPKIRFEDQWIIVTVNAKDAHGRSDADIGVVSKTDMQGNFGNALMKAVTKSKRRVTLSICGLGMLDETEVETIPAAIVHPSPVQQQPQVVQLPAKSQGGQHVSGDTVPDDFAYQTVLKVLDTVQTADDLAAVKVLIQQNRSKMTPGQFAKICELGKTIADEVKQLEADAVNNADIPI